MGYRFVRLARRAVRENSGGIFGVMDKLARESGLSVSAFERRFRRVVGTSPKKYASVVRLRYVTGRWAGGENLSQLAHEAGYCDQSHFIKDLKKFIGRPPASFFG
jgi:AraC-like DNA-binding protein